MSRVNLGKAAPGVYKLVVELDKATSALASGSGFEPGFLDLLKFRASQVNGCAFCLRLHGRDSLSARESADRLNVLAAWRESGYFTGRERAALALVEAVTTIADGQVPDHVYEIANELLSAAEIAAVEWIAITINVWNRVAIASRYETGK